MVNDGNIILYYIITDLELIIQTQGVSLMFDNSKLICVKFSRCEYQNTDRVIVHM